MWHIEDYPSKYLKAKKGTKVFVESPKFLTSRFFFQKGITVVYSKTFLDMVIPLKYSLHHLEI